MIDVINALMRGTSLFVPCCDRYASFFERPAKIEEQNVTVVCPHCKSVLNLVITGKGLLFSTVSSHHMGVTIQIDAPAGKPDCVSCGHVLANFMPNGLCDAASVECQKCHTWNDLTAKLYLKDGEELILTTPDQYFVKYKVKRQEP